MDESDEAVEEDHDNENELDMDESDEATEKEFAEIQQDHNENDKYIEDGDEAIEDEFDEVHLNANEKLASKSVSNEEVEVEGEVPHRPNEVVNSSCKISIKLTKKNTCGGEVEEEGVLTRMTRSKNVNVVEKRDHPIRKREKNKNISSATWEKSKRRNSTVVSKDLSDWIESAERTEFESTRGVELNQHFFESLLTPSTWLNGLHIDEYLYFVAPSIHIKVVVLDTFFSYSMEKERKIWISNKDDYTPPESLMTYLRGEQPYDNGKDWKLVRYVYIPFLLKEKHWVALEIDLDNWVVNVYDPDVNLFKMSSLHVCLNGLTSFLPVLISFHKPLTSIFQKRGHNPLNITRDPTLPRNTKGGNCAIFTAKYIEILSTRRGKLKDVTDKSVEKYRKLMAISIFARELFDK